MKESRLNPLGNRPNASALRCPAYRSAGFLSSFISLITYARICSRDLRLFFSGARSLRPVISLICCRTSSAAAAKSASVVVVDGPDLEGAATCCALSTEMENAANASSSAARQTEVDFLESAVIFLRITDYLPTRRWDWQRFLSQGTAWR